MGGVRHNNNDVEDQETKLTTYLPTPGGDEQSNPIIGYYRVRRNISPRHAQGLKYRIYLPTWPSVYWISSSDGTWAKNRDIKRLLLLEGCRRQLRADK